MPRVIVAATKREHFHGYRTIGKHFPGGEQVELTVTEDQLRQLRAEPRELMTLVELPEPAPAKK